MRGRKIKLSDIDDNEKYKHDISTLRNLYRDNVCNFICDDALELMTEVDLRKYIIKAVYKRLVEMNGRNRSIVISKISHYLGYSEKSIKRWFPSKKNRICKKSKSTESLVVKEPQKETVDLQEPILSLQTED